MTLSSTRLLADNIAPPELSTTIRLAFLSVNPEIVTRKSLGPLNAGHAGALFSKIVKMRELWLPSIVSRLAPGPTIVSGPSMRICPVVSVIVPVTVNVMLSGPPAALACAMASRRLPGPASLSDVTGNTTASDAAAESANAANTHHRFIGRYPFRFDKLAGRSTAAKAVASRTRAIAARYRYLERRGNPVAAVNQRA